MTNELDAPGGAHLDAETLAAWADEALDARERTAVEAHAADCARCQALLAAMVRTLPPPAAAAPVLRARSLWWLAAMAPIAAALVVWFAVPERAPVLQSETAQAVDQAAPAEGRAKARAETAPAASDQGREAPSLEKKAEPLADAAAPAAAPPARAPGAPGAAAESSLRRESAPALLSPFANAVDRLIVSSNPATRFRLLPGGDVQRSADGGAAWRTETTGATATLTAGSSPSPSVCWLIGPNGVIVLSTDGRSWRRLTFPEPADLRSIAAADSENATVTTADGRAFVTTDGGLTWARAPEI